MDHNNIFLAFSVEKSFFTKLVTQVREYPWYRSFSFRLTQRSKNNVFLGLLVRWLIVPVIFEKINIIFSSVLKNLKMPLALFLVGGEVIYSEKEAELWFVLFTQQRQNHCYSFSSHLFHTQKFYQVQAHFSNYRKSFLDTYVTGYVVSTLSSKGVLKIFAVKKLGVITVLVPWPWPWEGICR